MRARRRLTARQLRALFEAWPRVRWPTVGGRWTHVRRTLCRELVRRGALPRPGQVH